MACRYLDGSLEALTDFLSVSKQQTPAASASAERQPTLTHPPQACKCAASAISGSAAGNAAQRNGIPTAGAGQESSRAVARLHADDLSYDRFVREFMALNKPVIIQVSNLPCALHATPRLQEVRHDLGTL